ncbi:sugar phosphate isomerase/epimerase family protein [Flectobacillus roseus]|uniref:Sugar phosphate isomerase/epimerase family protein n=1 Tax=Flectobacillus roseus TaxID=502259 RepID=A0ABT6Y9H8_9BACT|nr:sugar phosphate isomerase/epimerase family protein [Flectobacillus roseus]MDI9860196.1 sugar phosphate isomerase/epimerase family protein [Flectobacillus roseus]
MNSRRDFLKTFAATSGVMAFAPEMLAASEASKKLFFEISLAEWSLHKAIFGGQMTNLDFPVKARKDFGIGIVEYVNTCFKSSTKDFKENGKDSAYLKELLMRCNDNGVKNHLIMCDAEGDMGDSDEKKRLQTVDNHKKWVEAAKFLGCKTIRVNAGGKGSAEEVAKNAADGLAKLSEFAATMNINVIVENHGGYSSNGEWLTGVMKAVNMKNCGTLPDFGNFCIKRDATNWRTCVEEYDRYKGVKELMPFAKGVSAKTNVFDADGNERVMDYVRLMKIVKDAGFKGIVGIEFEGEELSEDEGIKATLKLLQKVGGILS